MSESDKTVLNIRAGTTEVRKLTDREVVALEIKRARAVQREEATKQREEAKLADLSALENAVTVGDVTRIIARLLK